MKTYKFEINTYFKGMLISFPLYCLHLYFDCYQTYVIPDRLSANLFTGDAKF